MYCLFSGDLLGPTVNNLDKLLQMPTGCGEQTMLGFAPDVFVTNYLTATNQLTGDIEQKAIGYMESGNRTPHLHAPLVHTILHHTNYTGNRIEVVFRHLRQGSNLYVHIAS